MSINTHIDRLTTLTKGAQMKKLTLLTLLAFAVATHMSFAAAYYTGFEDATKPGYDSGDNLVTLSNKVWLLENTLIGTLTGDRVIEGVRAARLRHREGTDAATVQSQVMTGNYNALSFTYVKFGNDGDTDFAVHYSTDEGMSWVQIGSDMTATSTDHATFSETFGPAEDIVLRIQTIGGAGTQSRIAVDSLALIPEPGVGLVFAGLALFGLIARRSR